MALDCEVVSSVRMVVSGVLARLQSGRPETGTQNV